MSEQTQGDRPGAAFSDRGRRALAAIAAMIIPRDEAAGLPGADDPAILAEILAAAAPMRATLAPALEAALEAAPQDGDAFRAAWPRQARLLQSLVAQCYYRDPRVMRALGMEVRPPFPKGFDLAPNDLSILDPVRARGAIWRKVP